MMPIISNGVILFKIDDNNFRLNNIKFEDYMKRNYVNCSEVIDDSINVNVKFLMIQRRHSLGYLEFMRGKYNVNMLNGESELKNPCINYLFEQMDNEEIGNIMSCEFDMLWYDLWGEHDVEKTKHYEEYLNSKEKFYIFKDRYDKNDIKSSIFGFN
jgi:hypothetical protein